ncbi:protein of unknown function [Pseudodesulfovibrio profundus]|uniref:Uncharacterized protein n=1 Tax=Pseudodesulfovibrio profundus TaxID=57320 RepID=A0A2C8F337_9BACT|nr:protein of unknown function [Pseudodesulfovibrio profundus]
MRYVLDTSFCKELENGKAEITSLLIEVNSFAGVAEVGGQTYQFSLSYGVMETDCPRSFRQDLVELIYICGLQSLPRAIFDQMDMLIPSRGGMVFRNLPGA